MRPLPQSSPLKLRFNISWIFAGNVFYAGCQWAMVALLAKLGSTEMVGQFTLGFAVTAPIIMFTNLQLRQIQSTDAHHRYTFADYFALRLLLSSIAVVICLGIAWGAGYRPITFGAVILVAIAKAIESISDIVFGLFQQQERMDYMGRSLILKGCLSIVLLVVGILSTQSILGGIIGLTVAWTAVLLGYDIPSAIRVMNLRSSEKPGSIPQELQPRWQLKTLIQLIRLALPLGAVMMLISLNTNVPNYWVEHQLGESQLGIFAALSYLTIVGNIVINAVCEAISPRLSKYYASANVAAFRVLLMKVCGVAAGLGGLLTLGSGWVGKPILTLLYNEEYAQHQTLLLLLMGGATIRYVASVLGYGMTAARYFLVQLPIFLTVTIVTALGCFWLLSRYGLMGVGWALMIGATVQLLISLGVIGYALFQRSRPLVAQRKA